MLKPAFSRSKATALNLLPPPPSRPSPSARLQLRSASPRRQSSLTSTIPSGSSTRVKTKSALVMQQSPKPLSPRKSAQSPRPSPLLPLPSPSAQDVLDLNRLLNQFRSFLLFLLLPAKFILPRFLTPFLIPARTSRSRSLLLSSLRVLTM